MGCADATVSERPCHAARYPLALWRDRPVRLKCRPYAQVGSSLPDSLLDGHGSLPWPSSCASATLSGSLSCRSKCTGGVADVVANVSIPAGADGRVSLANPWSRPCAVAISFCARSWTRASSALASVLPDRAKAGKLRSLSFPATAPRRGRAFPPLLPAANPSYPAVPRRGKGADTWVRAVTPF
jgi:hypothetical protein